MSWCKIYVMNDDELMRKIIPSRPIVDLGLLEGTLRTQEGFTNAVQRLCPGGKLPAVFPNLPTYFRARNAGLTVNKEAMDLGLTLPLPLLNSSIYSSAPELRGPMEEIIINYEQERFRQRLQRSTLVGDEWSDTFKARFKKIYAPLIGPYEKIVEDLLDLQGMVD